MARLVLGGEGRYFRFFTGVVLASYLESLGTSIPHFPAMLKLPRAPCPCVEGGIKEVPVPC